MSSEFENFNELNNNKNQSNQSSTHNNCETSCKTSCEISNEYKIFVGNVPYHCTQEEFDACFLNVEGFVRAEIITIHKTNMSRGFGFVSLKTLRDAEILKKRNDINFKGRTLRFTSYQDGTYKPIIESFTNYVSIDGIPDGKDREWLKTKFSNYEPIGRCFISMNQDTGELKSSGVIEVLDENKYKHIISKRWHDIDGKMIESSRYKNKIHFKSESPKASSESCSKTSFKIENPKTSREHYSHSKIQKVQKVHKSQNNSQINLIKSGNSIKSRNNNKYKYKI